MFEVIDKMTWWQATSAAAPAATVLPGNKVLLAWRGNPNSRSLTVAVVEAPSFDPEQMSDSSLRTTVLPQTSDFAPALAFHDGQAWIAWTGTDGGHTVNVAGVLVGLADLAVGEAPAFVRDGVLAAGAVSGPSLSANPYIDQLSVHAVTTTGEMADSGSSSGGSWTTTAYPPARGARGPLAVVGDGQGDFVNAWTDPDGHIVVVRAADSAGLQYRSEQTSEFAPALAVFRGTTYIAWTGTDQHLNVGELDSTGRDADPITGVRTFDEQSLAGPAMISRTGATDRLALLWTGVDGTGAINGGVVNFG